MLGEISLKIRNTEFQQSPTDRFALLHAVRRIQRTWYSLFLCAFTCSANCYWQLFALAYYEVSDAVLIFRLHICQADFTDIIVYPSAVTAWSVSRCDCQRATMLIPLWHGIRLVILTDGNCMSTVILSLSSVQPNIYTSLLYLRPNKFRSLSENSFVF